MREYSAYVLIWMSLILLTSSYTYYITPDDSVHNRYHKDTFQQGCINCHCRNFQVSVRLWRGASTLLFWSFHQSLSTANGRIDSPNFK